MNKISMMDHLKKINELKLKYGKAGQSHVFEFIEDLNEAQLDDFISQLDEIDPDDMNVIFNKAITSFLDASPVSLNPKPLEASLISNTNDEILNKKWWDLGISAIQKHRVKQHHHENHLL